MTEETIKTAKKAKKAENSEEKKADVAEEKIQESEEKKAGEKTDEKNQEHKHEEKKPVQTKPKEKKSEAVVNSYNLPISTKDSAAVCKFIKGKKIEKAISDLELVSKLKKPVPIRGEIPHKKGKIMSGKYPKKVAQHFINILKTLEANSNVNGLNEPVIRLAIANIASRPYSKFGRVRKKRTHINIVAVERKNRENKMEANK